MSVGTLILALINLNLARFLNILITSWIVNKSRTPETRINSKQKFVMWIAGLRGAMAYALSLESSQSPIFNNPATGHFAGEVMLVVTIIYSLFTILGVSSILHPIMVKCEVTGKKPDQTERTEDEMRLKRKVEKEKLEKNFCMRLKRSM